MTAPGQVASTAKDQGTQVLGTAKDEAGTVAGAATSAASDVAGTAKEQAGNVIGETMAQAKDLTSTVKEQASQQLGDQTGKLVEGMRGMATQLGEGDVSGMVGQVLSEVGKRVQSLADALERTGPQGVVGNLRGYARSNPTTFLLGAGLAGLVSGRLAKGMTGGGSSGSAPHGTLAGDPLAGITETGLGDIAGYTATPYPDSSYNSPATHVPLGDETPLFTEARP